MKSNILQKLFNLLVYIVIFIISVIFLAKTNYIWLLLYLICIIFLIKKDKIKNFSILIFVTSFLLKLIMIISVNLPQVYDFKLLLDASKMFANGDYSFNTWWHFRIWSYQTGFVVYQGLILKIFNSEIILKLLQAVYSSLLCVIIYKIAKKITNEKAAKVVSLLYMIFPYHMIMNLTLVNHHLSTLLMYMGILFLLKENIKTKDYIFAAIFIAFGNIIRPEGIIIVFSLCVYILLTFDKEKIKNTLINASLFILVYLFINASASFLIIKTGVNPNGLKNNDPLWKFVLGFNSDACGFYNKEDDIRVFTDHEDEKEIIKERLLTKDTGKLMTCKINSFWLSNGLYLNEGNLYDKTVSISNIKIKLSKLEDVIMVVNQTLQYIVILFMILGLFVSRKNVSKEYLFLLILTIVTFLVYLLIEVQARYSYFIFITVFILASKFIEYIQNKIGSR